MTYFNSSESNIKTEDVLNKISGFVLSGQILTLSNTLIYMNYELNLQINIIVKFDSTIRVIMVW